MSLKARFKNPFVQQYVLEILFPLIGYFFFDWSIVVIVVFYLVDYFASETAFVFRVKRVTREKKTKWLGTFILATSLSLVFIGATTLIVYFIFPKVDGFTSEYVIAEVLKFSKDELWFLFPLVILMYLFKDQFTFYMPRRYLNYEVNKMICYRVLLNSVIGILVATGFLVWAAVPMHEAITIVVFLGLKLIFDFTIAKLAESKSQTKS